MVFGHDGRAPPRAGHPDDHTERRLSAQADQRARALRRARKQIWISVPSARTRFSSVLATCVHPPDWILCAAAKAAGGCRLRRELRGLARGIHDKPSELGKPLCVRHRPAVIFAMVTFLSRAHSSSQSLVSTDTLPPTILLATASCTLTHRLLYL